MSLAVLEAMATGLPAIGSKTLAAIVESGRSGFIVPDGSTEEQVQAYRDLLLAIGESQWTKMGGEARTTVCESFTWDRIAEQTSLVYLETVRHQQ